MVEPLRIQGLAAFRSDLRKIDKRLSKAIQVAHKRIATERANTAREAMKRSRYPQAHSAGGHRGAADGVRPRATQKNAKIALLGSNKFVRAMEFGTRYHRLFGRSVFANAMTRRVFPPWVGNQFDGGDWKDSLHGRMGHFVHPTIDRWVTSGGALDELVDAYEWAFREAYPDRS